MKKLLTICMAIFVLMVMQAANTQRSVTQVTSSVTISSAWDYHITSTTPFATTGSVNITNADAVVILDNVRPTAAQAYLSFIRINGSAAVKGTNCQLKIYNNGCIIMPHGDSFQPLTVYANNNYSGTSYSNYNVGTKYNLTSSNMKNGFKSFKLKRGYMVCMSHRPDGLGVNRLWVAADEDLSVALPNELSGRVSWLRIVQWNNVSKKGTAGNGKEFNEALNSSWTYNWDAGGTAANDCEYVTMLRQRWWPSAQECDDNSATHILGQNEPDNLNDANEAQYARSATEILDQDWVNLMKTGKRLGSPALSSHWNSLLSEFMQGIEDRGWRCDFVALHCYWYNDWSQWKTWLDEVYNQYHRPIWITEMNYGANWTGWPGSDTSGSTANQQIEYNHMKPILDGLASTNYIERVAVYNAVQDCRAFWLNNNVTQIGVYYRDLNMGLAYNKNYTETFTTPVYEVITNLSKQYEFATKKVTLLFADPNYDLTNTLTVQMSSNNGSSWSDVGTITVNEDICQNYTYTYTLSSSGTYQFRIKQVAYDGSTIKYSNIVEQVVMANISESSTNVDLTNIIVTNPTCSSMSGWDCWNASQAAWQYQNASYTNGSVTINGFLERWQDSGNPSTLADCYARQTYTGIPNGIYVLEADVLACNQSSSMSYTNDQKGAYLYAKGYRANHVEFTTGSGAPQHQTVTTYVDDNALTIGFKTDFTRDNWIAFDNIKLTYNGGTTAIFKSQINDAVTTANNAKSGATTAVQEAITAAITEAQTVRDATASTVTDYCAVIARLENLTMQAQGNTVLTYYSDDDRWAHNITPATAFSTKEYYNSAPFDFHRELTNLSAGVYTLKVQGFQRPGSNADAQSAYAAGTDNIEGYLYAGSKEKKLLSVMADGLTSSQNNCNEYHNTQTGKYVPNDMHTANVYFSQNLYENELSFLVREDGTTMQVGVKSTHDGGGYWTIFDNFRLEYKGKSTAALQEYMNELIAEVFDAPMYHVAKENMLAAKTQAETDYANGNGDALFNDLEALDAAIAVARTSAAVYTNLGTALTWSQTKKNSYSRTAGLSAYNSAYSTVNSNYQNGTYTNDEIADAVIDVKELTNRYLMSDIVAANTASETNPVDVTSFILENASFDTNADGWFVSGTGDGGYSGAVSYGCFEIYNKNFGLAQTLYGMPTGVYRVETQAFYREGGQPEHKASYEANTLVHNGKIFIMNADGDYTYGNIAPITLNIDRAITGQVGGWYDYDTSNHRVPDQMQSAGNAFDDFHMYQPTEDYNTVTARFVNTGSHAALTLGGIKRELIQYDWTIFANFKIYYLGNTVTLDEESATAPIATPDVDVVLKRTIKASPTWNTICLPFSLDADQLTAIFGSDVVLKRLTNAVETNGSTILRFTQVNALEANVPYIMKTSTSDNTFNIKGIDITPSIDLDDEIDDIIFRGNYIYPKVLDNTDGTDYYITGNLIKSSPGSTKIKGFRAYFHTAAAAGVKSLAYDPDTDDTPTAIETLDGAFVFLPADIYTVGGQLVRRHAMTFKDLPRGFYLVGGQKVYLK